MGNSLQATNKLQQLLKWWKTEAMSNCNRRYNNGEFEVRILEEMCKVGADFRYLEKKRGFALIPNVFWSNRLIQFFVDRAGANVNSGDEKGDTALHLAIRHTDYESGYEEGDTEYVVKYLLNNLSANPNVANLRGETPLFALAKCLGKDKISFPSDSPEVVVHPRKRNDVRNITKLLVDGGADVTTRNYDGESILHKSVYDINRLIIQKFKEGEVDVRTSSWLYSKTPLMAAVSNNEETIFRKDEYFRNCHLLLERGAFVNATDLQGYTALHHAVLNGAHECAKLLIEKGADPNVKSSSGRDPYDLNIYRPSVSDQSVFTHSATPRKQVEMLEIVGAMEIMGHREAKDVTKLWDQTLDICKKSNLQHSQEFLSNSQQLSSLIQNSNPEKPNEEIQLLVMNIVARLSGENSTAKFWNLLYSLPTWNLESWNVFNILNFLSEELKRVEEFASLEEIDFDSLSELVSFFKYWLNELVKSGDESKKNEALTPDRISHVHSIARLVIACFNKLTHATNDNKVSDTCVDLYVRL